MVKYIYFSWQKYPSPRIEIFFEDFIHSWQMYPPRMEIFVERQISVLSQLMYPPSPEY